MNTYRIFTGLLLFVFVLTVSLLTATPASAISGGQPDGNGHPHVGALEVRLTGRRIPCTGTVISPTNDGANLYYRL